MEHVYGWRRDLPDPRDHIRALTREEQITVLPDAWSLRSKMPPVYNQGQLGSCHDDETEVLTENGWKLFSDLDEYDRLASVDPATGRLIYEFPSRIIRLPYTGELVCGYHSNLDFRVTPDHTMLVRKWNEETRTLNDEYEFVSAKNLGWYAGLMNRITWTGGEESSDTYVLPGVAHRHKPQRESYELPMKTWLHFLGIYLAEGTLLKRDQQRGRVSYKIQIAASKPREKNFVRDLLAEMGIIALELDDRFTFNNKRIYEALARLGLEGIKAPDKFVPEFVFQQSGEMIKEFLFGHFQGDGCEDANRSHYTSSVRLADDLQRLIFLSGDESHISVREPRMSVVGNGREVRGRYPEHRVSVRERANKSIDKQEHISTEWYDGEVFCAEVPTYHTLITRRSGNILISGNCTANAIGACVQYQQMKQKEVEGASVPSRLFIYWNERNLEGTVTSDAGAAIRDGMKVIGSIGAPAETDWPYVISKFTQKPPTQAFVDAQKYTATYGRVSQSAHSFQTSVYFGRPVVFGFTVFESFETGIGSNGIMPMPNLATESVLGGHAVCIVGYKHINGQLYFEVRNSWGSNWGDAGYFWMPAQFAISPEFANDCWHIDVTT